MTKKIKRILSLLIGVIMIVTMVLSPTVFAVGDSSVCYIGSMGYNSLAEAVMSAKAGDTIWMTADDAVSGNFSVDKSITIELEGYTLANACICFTGNIDVKINDRIGTAELNKNRNIGYRITADFGSDHRPRASFYLTGGANVTISGTTGGTKFYGGYSEGLPKAFVVGKSCKLTVNGATMIYDGGSGSDGIFVCDTGILTINDILIDRFTSYTNGSSLSYANVPTTENPLTIVKGHFYGGMWVEGYATINGVSLTYGRLTFEKIEKALLYTSEGSYIDYDKSTDSNGWEIWISSTKLSVDTDIDNVVDTYEALRVSAGGEISALEGQKVVFQPQVTGGDGATEIIYSWTFNGVDTGINSANYSIDAAKTSDAGTYVFTARQGNAVVSSTYVLSVGVTHTHDDVDFQSWTDSDSLPTSAGNYRLESDVTISKTWNVPAGVTNLCLNGKSINLNSNHIEVKNGATLNIYDCGDTVRYYDTDSATSKWTLKSEGTSDYTTIGGVITGGSAVLGGAVAVFDSTLNLYGGNIVGNEASTNNGGGIYTTNSTLVIDGANIFGNYAFCSGGGVFAHQTAVTINKGSISYNRACITDNQGGDGGGLYLSGSTTTINGGNITYNTNLYDGAGIMNSVGGTLTINGGSISNNATTFWGEWSEYTGGAGVCNDTGSTLILNSGTISNNTGISNGGGVFNRGTFNMNGGSIEGNICISLADKLNKGLGDGVANETGATFKMTGGYIGVVHNELLQDDFCRGVYNKGTFTMTGGEIFTSSDDVASCYGLSNYATYNLDGTETSGAIANIGGNAIITGQCGYKPFAVNGTGTINIEGNVILTAKNVGDCKDNRARAIYMSNGTLNISGSPEIIALSDPDSSNVPDANGIRFEPKVTVNMSGNPKITAETSDIQMEGTPSEPATYINITGKLEMPEKPFVVIKRSDSDLVDGVFTKGWSTYMSDAEYKDYFDGSDSYTVALAENELHLVSVTHYTITVESTEGGIAKGTATVAEGESVTLNATANEGYEFIGWYDGDELVCATEEFVVENVSEDKTYTAKFELVEIVFDFTSIRTGNGKNIVVDHEKQVISVEVETGDNLVLYVHQKEHISGGQIRLNSYNGNKVTYNSAGSYNIYSISDEFITVSAKITIGNRTEIYDINIRFVEKAVPFTSIRTANGTVTKIDHDAKKIYVDAAYGDDNLVLYVHQKNIIPNGQIRMNSYNGNRVTYEASGIYKIYTLGGNPITVSAKVIIDGVTDIYDIIVNYSGVSHNFDFSEIKCDNASEIKVDHENKIITIIADSDVDHVVIYKKQYDYIKGTLALTSFMGNRVQSNQADGTYTVCYVKNPSVDVKAKITINGVSEEYIIRTVFAREWGFENLKADNVIDVTVDHDSKTVVMNTTEGSDEVVLYIDQICDAGDAQVWMKSYNGNKVSYNSSDRTYTIKKGTSDSLTVSVKITMLGETRVYDLTIKF